MGPHLQVGAFRRNLDCSVKDESNAGAAIDDRDGLNNP